MVRTGHKLWQRHPVAQGRRLSFGERAADVLKHYFGTWTALGAVAAFIAFWVAAQAILRHPWDPYPYILLNLLLSMLAAVQGIILQISANRGDRISAEVALHTQGVADGLKDTSADILDLQHRQLEILALVQGIEDNVNQVRATVCGPEPPP